jgi:ribonuclease-3
MNQKIDFTGLEKILNLRVKDIDLFTTAFTHRSYLNEHQSYELPSNERLEFLGDAVLQLLSSEHLYKNYPNPEGDLTNFRAAIVCTESLATEAGRLEYGRFLLLSKGEEANGGRDREYILANTFEAVLGAMFLQEGLEKCREFVQKELLYKVDGIIDNKTYKDAKSEFQEKAQEKLGVTPSYVVLDSWGPDHEKMFKVGVYLSREEYGVGEGASKQKAEQEAAIKALDKLTSIC